MKKTIAIIGLSRFGLSLIESFSKLNVELVAIDTEEEQVKKAGEFIENAFVGDTTNLDALREAGIANVDHAIVAIGQNDRQNLTTSIISIIKLKELGIKEITARADEEDYAEVLRLVGATNVVMPLHIATDRVANKLASSNVLDYFNVHQDYDMFELQVGAHFKPLPIVELNLRNKYHTNILLIERDGTIITPTKDITIMPNDIIFVFGKKKDVAKVITIFK